MGLLSLGLVKLAGPPKVRSLWATPKSPWARARLMPKMSLIRAQIESILGLILPVCFCEGL